MFHGSDVPKTRVQLQATAVLYRVRRDGHGTVARGGRGLTDSPFALPARDDAKTDLTGILRPPPARITTPSPALLQHALRLRKGPVHNRAGDVDDGRQREDDAPRRGPAGLTSEQGGGQRPRDEARHGGERVGDPKGQPRKGREVLPRTRNARSLQRRTEGAVWAPCTACGSGPARRDWPCSRCWWRSPAARRAS